MEERDGNQNQIQDGKDNPAVHQQQAFLFAHEGLRDVRVRWNGTGSNAWRFSSGTAMDLRFKRRSAWRRPREQAGAVLGNAVAHVCLPEE